MTHVRHRQRREADDHVAANQASGGLQRQIVHADVNPVRVCRDRDIDAVVDEEERPRGPAAFAEGDGQVVHLPARHSLGTQLKRGDPPGQRVVDHRQEVTVGLLRIGDEVDRQPLAQLRPPDPSPRHRALPQVRRPASGARSTAWKWLTGECPSPIA